MDDEEAGEGEEDEDDEDLGRRGAAGLLGSSFLSAPILLWISRRRRV